jgi:hypothetical protein
MDTRLLILAWFTTCMWPCFDHIWSGWRGMLLELVWMFFVFFVIFIFSAFDSFLVKNFCLFFFYVWFVLSFGFVFYLVFESNHVFGLVYGQTKDFKSTRSGQPSFKGLFWLKMFLLKAFLVLGCIWQTPPKPILTILIFNMPWLWTLFSRCGMLQFQ